MVKRDAGDRAGGAVSVERYRALLADRLRAEGVASAETAEHAELVFNLTRLYSRMTQDFEAMHRRRGWTWAGFRIMNVLWALDAVELRDVARLSGGSRAAISAALNALQRAGLVTRIRDDVDRRLVRLELTEPGRAALTDAIHAQAELERRWLDELDTVDQRRLTDLLARLADQKKPRSD